MAAIPKKAQDNHSAVVNTLLVIGAGEAQNIDADWRDHYRRLVLVEPLPERAQFLRKTFGEDPDIEVLEAAIVPGATPGDTTTLYEYNWPQATSRHKPAELLQLFPGLKTERMWRVSALSTQHLIQEIGLSLEGEHGLILDTPADEGPILAALVESNAYKCFSCIQLRYPVAGLYDTPEDPETMLEALTAYGFEIESQDRTDPDWPSMRLIRNRWKIAFEEARETIKALEAQLAERVEAVTAAEQLAQDRAAEVQKLAQARDTLDEQLAKQQAKAQTLEGSLSEAGKRLEQEAAGHKAQAELRWAELAKLKQAYAAVEQQRDERQSQVKALEQQLQEHKQTLEKRTAERNQQAKHADELAAKATQSSDALARANKLAETRQRELSAQRQELDAARAEQAKLQTRQTQLEQELIRAEAQIDLIKSLMLREESL